MPRRTPPVLDDPDASPGYLLWQVANLWQRRQRAALAPLGLTHVQFVLLAGAVALSKAGEPVTQARLARHARLDAMTTSQVVRALQSRKLLRRLPHPRDPRARSILPTAAGRRLAREAAAVVQRVDEELFSPLGSDRARLVAMIAGVAEGDDRRK